jgi:glycosyltransferase involved in cell wall biosynthesis
LELFRSVVSVTIPTLNRPHYLDKAIDSVLKQRGLGSDFDVELFVVDNGNLPETADVVLRYGDSVRLLRIATRGIGYARNAGVDASSGEYLAFLDDDDIWTEDKLQKQLQVFTKQPEVGAVFGHMQQFLCPDVNPAQLEKVRHLNGQVIPAPLATSILMRRSAWDRVGYFDTTLQIGVDIDWYSRLCDAGLELLMLPDVLYLRRIHETNTNFTHSHEKNGRLLMLKRIIDRRRAAEAAKGALPLGDQAKSQQQ